jgi:hypothetical protein
LKEGIGRRCSRQNAVKSSSSGERVIVAALASASSLAVGQYRGEPLPLLAQVRMPNGVDLPVHRV